MIVHPGACVGCSLEDGMTRVVRALRQVCAALGPKPKVRLLLELTAGQGTCVGCSFEQRIPEEFNDIAGGKFMVRCVKWLAQRPLD